jgi:hypothetical protein
MSEAATATAPVKKRKFRVLAGRHWEGYVTPDGVVKHEQYGVGCVDKEGKPKDIVETDKNLNLMNTPRGRKFEELTDPSESYSASSPAPDAFDQMTKAQLVEFAKEVNMELDPAWSKAQMTEVLRKRVPPRAKS